MNKKGNKKMLKQMKKTLGSLLVVCFLISVTAASVSALNPQPEPPLNKTQNWAIYRRTTAWWTNPR